MEGVTAVWLPVQAVEDALVVSTIVNGNEFRRVQKMARLDAVEGHEVSEFRAAPAQSRRASPGPERAPLRLNGAEGLRSAQTGARGAVHNQASFVAVLGVRSAGNQLHALERVKWYLGGKHFALLIADGLAIDDETDLRVIAQRMEKAVGVRRYGASAVGDGLGQPAAGIKRRQLQKTAAVDVLMSRGIALHGSSRGLHIDCGYLGGHLERDTHRDGQ